MSSIRFALERLDVAVGRLDSSVAGVEVRLQGCEDALESSINAQNEGNIIDVDFVSKRLDSAIAKVEDLLEEG
ncbi:MAG: hypothetical protein ACRBCK_11140 [Alphaproteobacteria bacterium]